VQLEGWLHKKGEKGLMKSYKRRWFQQRGNKLYYFTNKGMLYLPRTFLHARAWEGHGA
jgi:hypothetical protein